MDPREIFRSDKLLEFWPTATQSAKDRTAATTRFIVYAMCILYLIKRDARILAHRDLRMGARRLKQNLLQIGAVKNPERRPPARAGDG